MANQNFISKAVSGYQNFIKSPASQAALLYAISLPAAYWARDPLIGLTTKYALNRAKTQEQRQKILQDVHNYKNSWKYKATPWVLAMGPSAMSLAMTADPNRDNFGWGSWFHKNASLVKKASLWQAQPYQATSNFSATINPGYISGLIQTNPVLSQSAYAQNLGMSIINAAPTTGFNTTLGAVHDSALNKFQKKLNFQGLAGSAIKGYVAGSMANMFTDVVGAMAGMPKSVMDPIRGDVGILTGVGTALSSILT